MERETDNGRVYWTTVIIAIAIGFFTGQVCYEWGHHDAVMEAIANDVAELREGVVIWK